MQETAADDAILVEPLAPAVGLAVSGVALDVSGPDGLGSGGLSDEHAAMLRDLWQVGGAFLFRGSPNPARAAAALGRVLAGDALIAVSASVPGGTEWAMVGAEAPAPHPLVCVVATEDGALPPLWLAGMEAAADALRLTNADTLMEAEGLHFAHSLDGPMLPVLQRHPQSGATILFPPPRRAAGKDPQALTLVRLAEEPRFCYRHDWQPGDVLAWDPRAVRSLWQQAPVASAATTFAIVRSASHLSAGPPEWELPL